MKKYNYILSQDNFYRIEQLSNVALSLRLLVKEFYMERQEDKKSFHGRCTYCTDLHCSERQKRFCSGDTTHTPDNGVTQALASMLLAVLSRITRNCNHLETPLWHASNYDSSPATVHLRTGVSNKLISNS